MLKLGLAGAVVALAVPIVPGLPDLDPAPEQGKPPQEQPPPQQQPPKEPSRAPTAEMRKVCKRMAAPWGSDSASGKATAPFRSPKRLARSLESGWTGCLRGGTYTQSETIVRERKVTLRSAPGERATWRGRIVLAGRKQKLVDLTLDGTGGRRQLPSPTISAPGITISDSDITHRQGICVHPRSWREPADGFVIQRNRIHDCGKRPPANHDHGIYVVDAVGGLIRDNVIFHNADRGIQFFPNAHRITVIRNTIDGNGSGVIFSDDSSRNVVRDNVISNSVERWNAESDELTGRGNRFESNCLKASNPKHPGYNDNGGVALPDIVTQRDNVLVQGEPYRARQDGDFTPVPGACPEKGAYGRALKPR